MASIKIDALAEKRFTAEAEALQAEAARPDHNRISAVWKDIVTLTNNATEEQQTRVYQGLVQQVLMTAKGEGIIRFNLAQETNQGGISSRPSLVRISSELGSR